MLSYYNNKRKNASHGYHAYQSNWKSVAWTGDVL